MKLILLPPYHSGSSFLRALAFSDRRIHSAPRSSGVHAGIM